MKLPMFRYSGRALVTAAALSSTTTTRAVSGLSSSAAATKKVANARSLGGTEDLVVSEACLGTMTWGVQNSRDDAFEQLDYALSSGINFVDTAELYPVPLTAPKWRPGATEEILGEYLSKKVSPSRRGELVIATKVAGYFPNSRVASARSYPSDPIEPFPDGRLDSASVRRACEASLRRLQTDYIDLYQIHWPDRYIPVFGQTMYRHELKRDDDDTVAIEETAAALRDLIEEGKIRYIGLSNETPLGVCEWVKATEKLGIRDKLATIQNSYSLVDRRFDGDLAEACDFHDIGLLPWSVLAGGLLSGKYREGAKKPASKHSRFVEYPEYMSRWSPATASEATLYAVNEYARIAEEAGMSPAELAISFVRTRPFVSTCGSVIVGATTLEQLEENLNPFLASANGNGSADVLDESLIEAIDEVHMKCRDPSCSL